MLVWKKAIDGLPQHQKSVFGWHLSGKYWIKDIWWDEGEQLWCTSEECYAKDDISHWMEHPSAPED